MSMRMKFVALTVATLLFVIGWFFVGFKPASSRLAEVKDEVETTRTEIAALQARLARLQELKLNEAQLRADAERYDRGLPTRPAVSDFIRQVQDAANNAGIDFLTISPSVPAETGGAQAAQPADPSAPPQAAAAAYRTIDVSMNANGGFFNVERFVSNLERLDRAIRIQTFNLSGGGQGDNPPLSLAINLKMFMGSVPAAAPAPAPAPPTGT